MTFDPSALTIHPGFLAFSTLLLGALTIIGVIWLVLGLVNVKNWEKGDLRLFITVLLVTISTGILMMFAGNTSRSDIEQGRENLRVAITDRYGIELSDDGMESLLDSGGGFYQWELHAGKGEQKYWTATDEPVELVIDGERQSMRFSWLGDRWILEDADGEELPVVDENETEDN